MYNLKCIISFGCILYVTSLYAQWEVINVNVIPEDYRAWSIKVARDGSVWMIASLDIYRKNKRPPLLLRSTDGGESWKGTEVGRDAIERGYDFAPVDSNIVFAALKESGLFRTVDAGGHWDRIGTYPHLPEYIHFFNKDEGIVIGKSDQDSEVISITNDGGDSWTHISYQNMPPGTSLPARDTGERLVFKTFSKNSRYDAGNESFVIGTTAGNIWISNDKGRNWERIQTPLRTARIVASAVAVQDENRFIAAGMFSEAEEIIEAMVCGTSDGGLTWHSGDPGITPAAVRYIPGSENTCIVVGHNDFGVGSEGTAISYHNGLDWQVLDQFRILSVDFLDSETGYGACCNNRWPGAEGQVFRWKPVQVDLRK